MSAADTTTPTEVPPPMPVPPPSPPVAPRRRRSSGTTPWLLLAPCLLILGLVMGYPLVRLVTLSFQKFGQSQLWGFQPAEWVGFDNFTGVLDDGEFWAVVVRTIVFAAGCVIFTMVSRHADRPAAPAGLRLGEDPDQHRAGGQLGHADHRRHHGLQVAVRRGLRHPQRAAQQAARRRDDRPQLVRQRSPGPCRDHAAGGLGRGALRGDHPERRTHPGPQGDGGGRPSRRQPAPGACSGTSPCRSSSPSS